MAPLKRSHRPWLWRALLLVMLGTAGALYIYLQGRRPSPNLPEMPTVASAHTEKRTPPDGLPIDTLGPVTLSEARRILPRDLASLAPESPDIFKNLSRRLRAEGYTGWPPVPRRSEFLLDGPGWLDAIHPTLHRLFCNSRALWIRAGSPPRWDLLVLATREDDPGPDPVRLVWIRHALGAPTISQALPKDTWGAGNLLSWTDVPIRMRGTGFMEARGPGDLASLLERRPADRLRFLCAPPGSDAGLELAFDPELGVAMVISGVEDPQEEGEPELMMWTLQPEQVRRARLLKHTPREVWIEVDGSRGVVPAEDWAGFLRQWAPPIKEGPSR